MSREFDPGRIRMASFDLDGTVLRDGAVSPAVRDALKALGKTGVAIVVSTARDLCQIPEELMECFDYRVTCNGASVDARDGKVISEHTIDWKTAFETLVTIKRHKGTSCLYYNGRLLVTPWFLINLIIRTNYMSRSHRRSSKSARNGSIILFMPRHVRKRNRNIYRFQTFFKERKDMLAAVEDLDKAGKVLAIGLPDNSMETTLKGVTKAHGLQELCDFLGCSPENIISFGDSSNDLEMLKFSGYSVGMGNAEDTVKQQVDYITDSVDDDGVATAIHRLFNI